MKKTLKVLAVVAILLAMLVGLTGCGNKLVATKDSEADGVSYKEKIEVKFKGDKIDKVRETMAFKDKDTAEKMKTQLDAAVAMIQAFGGEELGMKVKQSGKKLSIEFDMNSFAEMFGTDADISKSDLKSKLEEEGYKVK